MLTNLSQYKRNVARSFNRAADSYDAVADLQAEVGLTLLRLVRPYAAFSKKLADIGAGTGMFTPKLEHCFCNAECYFIDIAPRMLEQVQQRQDHRRGLAVCADFDALPFATKQFDFIFSSMCLQWSVDLLKSLFEIVRTLKDGGIIALAFLTSGTLSELDKCYKALKKLSPVNSFYSYSEVINSINKLPLLKLKASQQTYIKKYKSLSDLFTFLKCTGANYSAERASSLVTPAQNRRLIEYYQQYFSKENFINATFNVTYLILKK